MKSRNLAQALVTAGHVRVNRQKIAKAAYEVTEGDVLTVGLGTRVLVLTVKGFSERRGPYSTARLLYEQVPIPNGDNATAQKGDASDTRTC